MAARFLAVVGVLGASAFMVKPPSAAPRPQTAAWSAPPLISELLETPCEAGDAKTVSAAVAELSKRTSSLLETADDVLPFAADDDQGAETWLLRFLASDVAKGATVDLSAAQEAVEASIAWRLGEGRAIVDAARESYQAATAGGPGTWNNDPVLATAPSSSKIAPFVDLAKLLTLRNARQDGLVYAIRAGEVDDQALMTAVTTDELADFFLYAKAVNERVCAALAAQTDRLSDVVTVNDLSGINLFGDASFRNALSSASKVGDRIFPGLAGPTVLLNLPPLVSSLVKIFTPLFPASVQKRLKFAKLDLASPETFLDRAAPARAAFLTDVDAILAS